MVHLFRCDTSLPAAYAVKERKSKWPGLHKQNSHPWPEFGTAGAKTPDIRGLVMATWVLAEGSLEGGASQGSSFLWVEAALQARSRETRNPFLVIYMWLTLTQSPPCPRACFKCVFKTGEITKGWVQDSLSPLWNGFLSRPALHKPPFWLGSGAQWCFGSINPFQCRASVL